MRKMSCWVGSLLLVVFCFGSSSFSETESQALVFGEDRATFEHVLRSVDALLLEFNRRSVEILPILIPDPTCTQVIDMQRITIS